MSSFHPTGSLVEWKRASESSGGPGLVFDYEKKNTPLLPGIWGAWVQWPKRDGLMWSPIDNLRFLVNTGSL